MFKPMKIYFFLGTLLLGALPVLGQGYTYREAAQKYEDLKLLQPLTAEDGRVQTLNEKGTMSSVLDEATTQFMAAASGKRVLEIGGSYGKVMIETLSKDPSVTYHINDLDERHLFIAAHNLETAPIPESTRERVKFIPGDISTGLHISDSYDAILVARVLQFFSPEQMVSAVARIRTLLKTGGRVYIVAITPYVKRYERFIPEYERRMLQGEAFPGYVHSLADWVSRGGTHSAQLATINKESFMFLDVPVLTKLFKKNGFKILRGRMVGLGYFSKSWALDGRENVILIAEKVGR